MQVNCVFLCNFVDSSVSCFAEIFAFENIFGSGEGVDQFGFSLIGYVAQYQIAQGLQRHDTPACIGFAIRQLDRLPQVLLDDVFGEMLRTEERRIRRRDLFYACFTWGCFGCLYALVKINRRIVVNVDVITGIIVSIDVEIVDYVVH